MERGVLCAFRWQVARWVRREPGLSGGIFFLSIPFLSFFPLARLTFFPDEARGMAIISWLSAVALGLSLRGGGEIRDDSKVWLFQKGVSLWEVALEDWILDAFLLLSFSSWWGLVSFLALWIQGTPSLGTSCSVGVLALATGLVAQTCSLFLSSLGIRRASDPTALLAVLSILLPVLTLQLPPWIPTTLVWILPPFHSAIEMSGAIRSSDWIGTLVPLLRLTLLSAGMLSLALWQISGWRPRG
jgi:hypothetical protein